MSIRHEQLARVSVDPPEAFEGNSIHKDHREVAEQIITDRTLARLIYTDLAILGDLYVLTVRSTYASGYHGSSISSLLLGLVTDALNISYCSKIAWNKVLLSMDMLLRDCTSLSWEIEG
nr:hypothetical protein CFP56_52756 [Quercus suber]